MPIRAQGSTADFQLHVRNSSGDFVDPTNLSLTFKNSLGAVQGGFPVTYPSSVVKDAVGQYHYDWLVPIAQPIGTYTAQWDAILLGATEQAFETWEVVLSGSLTTGPLDFLQRPDDYDAIRGLLGVTKLDAEDADIELAAFAPHAELLIKQRVSNWATQTTDTDQLFVLRLATIYKTACLMAESYVRGGTIGLVRPLASGEGRDWAAAAETFCNQYEYWVNIADEADSTTESTSYYDIMPIRVGGPTRLRIERAAAGDELADAAWFRYPPYWPE